MQTSVILPLESYPPATTVADLQKSPQTSPSFALNARTARVRKALVANFDVLDTPAEQAFDDFAKLASIICQTPIAMVSLLDGDRQYLKACRGLTEDMQETHIGRSLCAHAIKSPGQVSIFGDLTTDARFADNPLVAGPESIRAYIGASLLASDGTPLGMICALNNKERGFSTDQAQAMQLLAKQVVTELEGRGRIAELERTNTQVEMLNEQLNQFAYIVSHDLKAPIRHQTSFAKLLLEDFGDELAPGVELYLDNILEAGEQAQVLLRDLNEYVHTVQSSFGAKHSFSLAEKLDHVIAILNVRESVDLTIDIVDIETVHSNATALRHVLVNLISNAIKFCTGDDARVVVRAHQTNDEFVISVGDNGPGIAPKELDSIFELFNRGSNARSKAGRGVGLAIAAKLTQNLGGKLTVESELELGSTFTIHLPKE